MSDLPDSLGGKPMIKTKWRAYPGIATYQTFPEHLCQTARHHMLKAKHFRAIGAHDIAYDRMRRAAHNAHFAKLFEAEEA